MNSIPNRLATSLLTFTPKLPKIAVFLLITQNTPNCGRNSLNDTSEEIHSSCSIPDFLRPFWKGWFSTGN